MLNNFDMTYSSVNTNYDGRVISKEMSKFVYT